MNPATRDWTCPNCGNHNGPAAPAHTPSARASMPSLNDRGPLLAIVAGVIVLLIAIWAIFLRDSSPTTAASPTVAVSTGTPVDTVAHLCTDMAADMPIRVDSVTRTEQAVRADAKTLKQEGNTEAAKAANAFADALGELAHALDTQGDTLAANQAVQSASKALPC
jgi:post-segregation antitoxin (ccd killing protein)